MKTVLRIFWVAYALTVIPAVGLAVIAYADFKDRGCFNAEAAQCGDARGVMLVGGLYLLVGFIVAIATRQRRTKNLGGLEGAK